MNRPLAALAAGAMLLASAPTLGFAEESTAESSATTSSSLTFDGPEWQRPCQALSGLLKAQCIVKHNPGKGNKKDRQERTNDGKALRLSSECKDLEGDDKVKCLRTQGKKTVKTIIKKAVKREILRTVRGKKVEASSSSSSN